MEVVAGNNKDLQFMSLWWRCYAGKVRDRVRGKYRHMRGGDWTSKAGVGWNGQPIQTMGGKQLSVQLSQR